MKSANIKFLVQNSSQHNNEYEAGRVMNDGKVGTGIVSVMLFVHSLLHSVHANYNSQTVIIFSTEPVCVSTDE